MNEGKPTKTKWWTRPRPTPDGDYELAHPAPAPDGDYELHRPTAHPSGAGTAVDDAGGLRTAAADTGGLREAGADTGGRRRVGGDTGAQASEGDGPVDAARADLPSGSAPDGADPRLSGSTPAVGAQASEGDDPVDAVRADLSSGSAPAAEPASGRPTPLHEPDPYSTPPYGEPGPWAPAPPVQHPTATPPHGMPPQPAPPHATAPPPGARPARAHADAPAHGALPATGFAETAPGGAQTNPAHADAPPTSSQPATGFADIPPPGAQPDPAFATAPPPGAQPAPAYADVPPSGAQPAPAYATPPPPGARPAPAFADAPSPGGPAEPNLRRRHDPWATPVAAPLLHSGVPGPRRRRVARGLVGGGLVLALVSGGVGGAIGAYLERNGGVRTVELPQAGKEDGKRAPDSVAGIAARALPSVVTLHVSGSDAAGTGTGFVLDDRGHILTNNHVVEPAGDGGEITVTFNSGDTAEATVVGRDSGYDLAVVRVKGVHGLTPMPLGNSENVRVGDPVVAIGAPFDLAGTVTSGIISAKERPITAGGEEGDASDVAYVDALQTDAPINPGNSGGPLLDARGRAIGINSAIRSADGGVSEPDGAQAGSIGLGFAIPINQGKRVAEELINTGKAVHPVIGITLDMNHTGDGARVADAGAAAGLKAGDVITAVDGQRVHSGEELIVKTRAHRPGDRLELTLERGGEETKVSLVLGSSDGD